MNDNDIIKALEFCESLTCECTSECPMFYNGTNSKSDCRGELHQNALDLINRQKAEIERLCERLDDLYEEVNRTAAEQYKHGKSDAIEEFAERMKDALDGKTDPVDEYDIDEIAQEMTEELT